MKKQDLLNNIADTAYNVGFGAKKHFATYDIVNKIPGVIGFISLGVGIIALSYDDFSTKLFSTTVIILGIIGLYISFYDTNKQSYDEKGKSLIQLFNELKKLFSIVDGLESLDDEKHIKKLRKIEKKYYKISNSKQILFSGWYAHYKFFWEHQIDWLHEHKQFKLFRDKLPISFTLFVVMSIIGLTIYFYKIQIKTMLC